VIDLLPEVYQDGYGGFSQSDYSMERQVLSEDRCIHNRYENDEEI
jgi:hypothetical protein